MTATDVEVPARYYTRLAEILIRQGIDFEALVGSVGLSVEWLASPDRLIKVSDVDRLLNRAVEVSGRSDLGFELGRMLTVSTHTFVGFAMLNSPDLDQALRFEARYFKLIMPSFGMRYQSGPDFGELYFSPLVPMSSLCLTQHLEGIAMAALREISDLTGNRAPDATIDFSMSEPAHVALYRALSGVDARFGTETTPGVRVRLLDNPRNFHLPIADPQSLHVAEERCKALVLRTTGERKFAEWVAMTLREVSEGLPTLAELAGLLNISKRTLNRYLEREGASYRELATRIQYEIACERLTRQGMSVSEVAYSLGFSDASNFSRAFRAAGGCSPGEFVRNAAEHTSPTR